MLDKKVKHWGWWGSADVIPRGRGKKNNVEGARMKYLEAH